MFSVVPHYSLIFHIDYSVWGRQASIYHWIEEVDEDCDSPPTSSPSVSELSSPLLHRHTISTVDSAIREGEEYSNYHTSQAEKLSNTESLFSPLSDTGTVDSAFCSLPPLVTHTSWSGNQITNNSNNSPIDSSNHPPLEEPSALVYSSLPPVLSTVNQPLREEEDSTLLDDPLTASLFLPTADPQSSIDSGLQSLPTQITTDPLPSVPQYTEELSITSMMLASHSNLQNHKPGTKVSSSNRGRCARCGKLVYFAERKVALGQQWHKTCFRCATCGRFLDPGKHCEHDGKPYCNMCYKNNFGPDGFRVGSIQPRAILEQPQSPEEIKEIVSKIEGYNLYKEHSIDHIKYKETGGRVFFEGVLKLYWGLKRHIVLASGSSNNYGRGVRGRESTYNYISIDDEGFDKMIANAESDSSDISKTELQRYMELAQYSLGTDELISRGLNDTSLEVLKNGESTDGGVGTIAEETETSRDEYVIVHGDDDDDEDYGPEERTCKSLTNSPHRNRAGGVILRQKSDVSDTFIPRSSPSTRRRSASFRKVQKYKKQEAREEKRSKFIPPYGKSTNLRVSNIQRTTEVIEMLLQKYNVENKASEFSLMVVHDSGAMEHVDISDFPLTVRLKLGPSEDVAKIYVMEASDSANMLVSQEAAEYIRFQLPELNIFLKKFEEEEEREKEKLEKRFHCWKEAIRERMSNNGQVSPIAT